MHILPPVLGCWLFFQKDRPQSSPNWETVGAACILQVYCKCVHTPMAVFVCYQGCINSSDLLALFSHVGKGNKKSFLTYNFLLCVVFCENNLSIPTSEAHTYLCSVFISEEPCVSMLSGLLMSSGLISDPVDLAFLRWVFI